MSDDPPRPPVPPRGSLRPDGGHGRRRIGEILLARGLVDEQQLASALAEQAGLDLLDPTAVSLDPELIAGLDAGLLRKLGVLPIRVDRAGRVLLATTDPTDRRGPEAMARLLQAPVDLVVCSPGSLSAALEAAVAAAEAAQRARTEAAAGPTPLDVPAKPPAIPPLAARLAVDDDDSWRALLAGLVAHQLQLGADRLRFSSWSDGASAQLRVGGRWAEALSLRGEASLGLIDALGSFFEVEDSGRLRLPLGGAAEERALVGRVVLRSGGRRLDLRLDAANPALAQQDLGLDEEVQRRLRQWTASREGLVLVVGGAASGRSTTLRVLAASLARYRDLAFVGEGPAPEAPGARFFDDGPGSDAIAEALAGRPRVLVVDDADEPEMAVAAFSAAREGCLVIASLAAHDAHDALQTLRDRGLPDALLGAPMLGLVEQRLLPALCAGCRTQAPPPPDLLRRLGLSSASVPAHVPTRGGGCARCHGTGTDGQALLATRVELGGGVPSDCSPADLRGVVDRARPRDPVEIGLALALRGRIDLAALARALAPEGAPVVRAEGGGWAPDMPEETVEAWAPLLDGTSLDQLLDLDPDPEADDRHVILLFDPNNASYQGLSAILPHDQCRIVAASDWSEALDVVRQDRPTAVLIPAAADPVATRGRIRAFRDDLTSAFLPLCVLVPPGTPRAPLMEAGADEVIAVADAASVRSGLLALIERVV
jgi:type IV pilus assembly protein PilB